LSGQLSFLLPIKNKMAFISENYWGYDPTINTCDDNASILNLGVRHFHKKLYFDFALSNYVLICGGGNGIFPIPSLSTNINSTNLLSYYRLML